MKNKLFLLLILSLVAIFALCACGDDDTSTDTSQSTECAHAYTTVDTKTKMPTCTESGYTTLECTLCHLCTEVTLDPVGHNFSTTFDWTSDYEHAAVLLECKTDKSHVYNVSATIKKETVNPTCQTVGTQKITATVTWGDNEYTDVKEFNLGLGECQNTYTFTLHGDSCTDGFDMEATCSFCEKKSTASFDSHVLFDMAHFPACGGEAVVNACPCGENIRLDEPNLCSVKVELDSWTETDENGTVYNYEHRFCVRCGFELIRRTNTTSEGCYSYLHRETQIVDGETLHYTFYEPNCEIMDFHEFVYSYNGEKIDSCENGYVAEAVCKTCQYTKAVTESTHSMKFDSEIIDISEFGACGGYLIIKTCPCEKESEVGYSISCDYIYSYEQIDIDGEFHTVKSYTCDTCKLEFIYDEYIKDATVYGLYRLTIDTEVKYELLLVY